ncbi:hypothetical protein L1I30_06450 [Gillisia sp. M10.2A]|uniref:HEPN domain-containing protein n=1 Tax=Gillisia lutea TaxID=2909668 RepID=A0ABS9EIK2_9FLAO|nr:hypothetical protein [Gillisia lutea]MCF4101298.1 hypothetical protein [Gillisia lutea]
MEKHLELTDIDFELQFKKAQLDPALCCHEAHLRLAYIHIKKYGLDKAVKNVNYQLYSYVCFLGAEEKYNHTLTTAAVKAVSHFMRKSQATNFKAFILEFPRLKYNFKELMSVHYKIDIFNSEKAKKEFLEPDLLPF